MTVHMKCLVINSARSKYVQITLHDNQKVNETRVDGFETTFHAENDAAGHFFASTSHFRTLNE